MPGIVKLGERRLRRSGYQVVSAVGPGAAELRQHLFVVHEEHALAPTHRHRRIDPHRPFGQLRDGGEQTVDARAPTRLALDPDCPAVIAHHAVDGREAEARSGARRLGREEGLESPGARLLAHAAPIVGDGHADVGALPDPGIRADEAVPRVERLERDAQRAPFRHRVRGVRTEIHEDHVHRAGIRDRGIRAVEVQLDLHRGGQGGTQQACGIADGLDEVDRTEVQVLPTSESEDARGHLLPALGRRGQLVEVRVEVAPRSGVRTQDLREPEDHAQDVVEVVRDAAGQPTQRLQLLRLAQALLERVAIGLGAASLRHVDDRSEDEQALVRLDRIESDIDGDLVTVLVDAVQLAAGAHRTHAGL